MADVSDGFALGYQLIGRFELADDLLRRVPGAFHGQDLGPVWPDEDSHSPWIDLLKPCEINKKNLILLAFFR